MPPSGYSFDQVQHIDAFLRSCSEALLEEAAQLGLTTDTALAKEIRDIERYSASLRENSGERAVLAMTRDFYCTWKESAGTTEQRVQLAIAKLCQGVADIHIPPEQSSYDEATSVLS